jgi:hypothetical protein
MCECKKEVDEIMVMNERRVAALLFMSKTMGNANKRLMEEYRKLPAAVSLGSDIPEIGMMLEGALNRAADIIEGKVAA